MRKVFGMMLLVAGVAGVVLAGNPSPEIDSTSAAGAIALISGGLLVIRGRKK